MRFFKWKLLLLSLSIPVCVAEEVQQGMLYPGGSFVESRQTGIGLTIPPGWQGAWPQGTEMFVMESANLEANIFMVLQQGDEAQLKALMSSPIQLEQGIQLIPATAAKKTGNTYTANYTVTGAPQLSGYIAARILPPSTPSTGVAFIAISANASKSGQVKGVTLKLVNGLDVKKPVTAGNTDSKPGSWQTYLKGRYIARYYTGSGYSEEQHLWLCSDGRFFRKFGSGGYSISGASGASSNQGEGFWTATGSTGGEGQLILQYGVGSVSEISIPGADYSTSGAGGERVIYLVELGKALYLDGKKWLRGNNDFCN